MSCTSHRFFCLLEFTESEYAETKVETLDQLREFQFFLEKSLSGDMTLVDEFGAAQLAIQAAGNTENDEMIVMEMSCYQRR